MTRRRSAASRRAILRHSLTPLHPLLRLQHIVVIVSPQHKEAFEEIFHNQLDIRDFNRLPPRLRQYAAQLWRNYGAIMAQYSATVRAIL